MVAGAFRLKAGLQTIFAFLFCPWCRSLQGARAQGRYGVIGVCANTRWKPLEVNEINGLSHRWKIR